MVPSLLTPYVPFFFVYKGGKMKNEKQEQIDYENNADEHEHLTRTEQ